MRLVFGIGSVLVTAAGIQLFVLTDHTATFFAWTIDVGLSAAFLGAFYVTALLLASRSAMETRWDRARVGVWGVWLFVTLTLVATLVHLSLFHLHDAGLIPRGAAWLWLLIYVVEPPAVALAILAQLRTPGTDGPRVGPLPFAFRAALALEAVAIAAVGFVRLLAPSSASWWPWPITPLVSQAIGAWLVGLGVVLGTAALENDRGRVGIAGSAYVVLGSLQLVAVARYAGDLRGGISAGVYLVTLVVILATGASALAVGRTGD